MLKEKLKDNFKKIYNQLNDAQKEAVNTIDGPVMVIAGPGTGKTQILGSRIGNILLQDDVYPQNILCLTFTDAGVVAMRKRLLSFIGADAYRVNISTYHSFCNEVIQGNLSLFQKNNLEPITDLESVDLFRKLIDRFPKGHLLKRYRGDVYFEIKSMQQLFALLKKEGWNIEEIINKLDHYIDNLPTTEGFYYKRKLKEFNVGDPKQPLIDAEIEKANKLKAALGEYENYNQSMLEQNRYDFNDMINWVIKAFEENKNLLAQYQEQYQYILVDEFQDSSGTQNKIVELLISYWDKPNVFVVGDDDQSIYRFQGAEIENMQAFDHRYKNELKKVVLTQNYRSTQPILDIAQKLIERNKGRLINSMPELSKDLLASNPSLQAITDQPEIVCYTTEHEEMIDITWQIETLIQKGIAPEKIAVIYRENKYGDALSQYLQIKNIPYYSKRNMNLFDIPLTKKIIQVFYYLASELDVPYSGDEMLFEILHYDWFKIEPITIAKETIEVANARYQKDNRIHSIRQLLAQKATQVPKDLFDVGLHPELKKVITAIENLLKTSYNDTLQNLLQQLLNDLGILAYIMEDNDKHWHLQVLTSFFNLVKQETHRNPSMNLHQFVAMLQTMQDEKIVLPLYQVNGTAQGVNLLTCHGSKGLEFTYVFFVGCNAHYWEKKRANAMAYNIAKYMQSERDENKEVIDIEEEEMRRLFYVAITRAELKLQLSYFQFKHDTKEVEPTMFIAEIAEGSGIKVKPGVLDEKDKTAFLLLELGNKSKPIIAKMEEDILSRSLEKFTMNVTALNAYLNCPIGFYYKNLIRIPSAKNESTEFGSAVHNALDIFFKKMMGNEPKSFPPKEELIEDFNSYMKKHREGFTKEQFTKRMEYGPMILSDYYDKYINEWNKIVSVEKTINRVVVKGVPLKGKIDKLEFDGKAVNVVDYKTGDYEKAKKIKKQFDRPNEKNPNGGDYWRQAVFYKILVDNYELKDWNVVSTEFDFIEPSNKEYHKEKIVINPEDITTVIQQIQTVWQKIQNRDFYTGCGKEECHWCNFVKENQLAVGFEEDVEDEITPLFVEGE